MTNPPDREAAVFGAALRLPSGERAAYLDEACGGDSGLRQRIEELLRASEEAGVFLQHPAADRPVSGGTLRLESSPTENPGDRIGRYKLLQQIGEGGCGVVYMAEQEEPVHRRVALKVIKLGMDTKNVIARFEAERQALALMDHPNIAKVLDAGATDTGRPYFVMELVRGIKITDYCDQNNLSTRQRLDLFIQVCQAIQHAHQKGVIHRDIKPSNILVTVNDGVPVPKVIDFGIAKATQGRLTDKTLFTAFEQFIGTPAYMSPEQAVMTSLDIDTRSDIYSLGVLLYELLTGKTPFDANALLQAGLDAMRRTILEVEPPKPSARLSTMLDAERATTASQRQTEPPRLIHLLKGDLDWIVMKCLEKDRTRRYETANGLAADIKRHLSDEPVFARPPTGLYRLQKSVRRNKLVFAAGVAVAGVLLLGIITSTWQAVRATHAKREALAAQAQAVEAQANEARLREQAQAEELAARRTAYASDMNLVQQALAVYDLSRAQELLNRQKPLPGQKDLRGWEWRYLWQFCQNDATSTFCESSNAFNSISFSRDGALLAAGSTNEVTVWDIPTRKLIYSHAVHQEDSSHTIVAFSPDDDLLVFNESSNVVVWSSASRTEVHRLQLDGMLTYLAYSAGGRLFSVCLSDKTGSSIAVWNALTGMMVTNYSAPVSDLSLDRLFAATRDGSRVAYASSDKPDSVQVAGAIPNSDNWTFRAADEFVTAVAFSPDGRFLSTGSGYVESSIKIWDVASRKLVKILEGHRSWVSYLKFSGDGKSLVSESSDQTIRLWNIETGQATKIIRCPLKDKGAAGKGVEGNSVEVAEDGRFMASGGDQRVLWWELASLTNIPPACYKLAGLFTTTQSHDRFWCFSPDSRTIVAAVEGSLKLFDSKTLQPTGTPRFGLTNIDSAAFSPDMRLLVAMTSDGELSAMDMARGCVLTNLSAHPGRARIWGSGFDPSGRSLLTIQVGVAGGNNLPTGNELCAKTWDARTWQPARSWKLDPYFWTYAYSPEKNLAATISLEGNMEVIPVGNPENRRHFAVMEQVHSIAFSPDGILLAVASENGSLELIDTSTLASKGILRGVMLGLHSVCFSPDGRRIAAGSDGKEAIKIWDLDSHDPVATLEGEGSLFAHAAFSPDGNMIGAVNVKGVLHLWRAPSWAEIEAREARK